jgi:hypothetical protein
MNNSPSPAAEFDAQALLDTLRARAITISTHRAASMVAAASMLAASTHRLRERDTDHTIAALQAGVAPQ